MRQRRYGARVQGDEERFEGRTAHDGAERGGQRGQKIWNRRKKAIFVRNPLISNKTAKGIFGKI